MLENSERFIFLKDRIGAIRSPAANIIIEGEAKALTYFYQGSDFRNPLNLISSSINNLEKGKIAVINWNAGTSYEQYKTPVIRDFIKETIAELDPELKVTFSGSHLVHISLNSLNDRIYLNMVNVGGECTNQQAIAYDEIPPLQDLSFTIWLNSKPSEVILQPEGKKLKINYHDGNLKVHIPELKIHSIIEIIP